MRSGWSRRRGCPAPFGSTCNRKPGGGQRRWSDQTINRVLAHLKTFAQWIHQHRPFPLGNPMAKLGLLKLAGVLDVERALTEAERRQLLDAADYLPVTGGRSKDRRRHGHRAATERPQRQGYRPWRNRAIIYALVETGMRRAEVTSIDLADVDFQRNTVRILQKGGQQRRCQVSKRVAPDYRLSNTNTSMCSGVIPSPCPI